MQALTFEAFGVRARVAVSAPEGLEHVRRLLPPGSQPCPPEGLEVTFSLSGDAASGYELSSDGDSLVSGFKLEATLEVLERELRALVALKAPAHIFVHAGVVGHRGAAIVMPGSSLAGKTSLVAALVRAGAHYYSDEFAPLDAAGLVHPFAKPLSIRNERYVQVDHHVDALGGVAGDAPLPVRTVVVASYEPGARWRPHLLSPGEAVLAVLAHTIPAQTRPPQALETISRSLERTAVFEGTRGEADTLAPLLLTELERALAES